MENNQSKRKYIVEPYNPEWKEWFEREATLIHDIFDNWALSIHHVGSTAVPGLAAKPVLDILVLVHEVEVAEKLKAEMEDAGYSYFGEYVRENSRLFAKERNNTRYVNVHVFPENHQHAQRMLSMREFLKEHPEKVEEYARIKLDLFHTYPNDYETYKEQKKEYIDKELRADIEKWMSQKE